MLGIANRVSHPSTLLHVVAIVQIILNFCKMLDRTLTHAKVLVIFETEESEFLLVA